MWELIKTGFDFNVIILSCGFIVWMAICIILGLFVGISSVFKTKSPIFRTRRCNESYLEYLDRIQKG